MTEQNESWKRTTLLSTAVGVVLVFLSMLSTTTTGQPQRRLDEQEQIHVFSAYVDNAVAAKQAREWAASSLLQPVTLTTNQQREYMASSTDYCSRPQALTRFDELLSSKRSHLAQELWKYCALLQHGGIYVDGESPLIVPLDRVLQEYPTQNVATKSHSKAFPNTLHGSFLIIRQAQSDVAKEMVELLVTSPVESLDSSPLLIPRRLYDLVSREDKDDWVILEQECTADPVRTFEDAGRVTHICPKQHGYCCRINDKSMGLVLMTRYPLLPYQVLPSSSTLPQPYNDKHFPESDLPFIATVTEEVMGPPTSKKKTPNYYDMLLARKCLPDSKDCSSCLREKKGANCETCREKCSCYCKSLCKDKVEPKHVSKELVVNPPMYARDPNRIIPRIIHQTWFEVVTKEDYPNMSRLMESWKRSGWDYKFYGDEDAQLFLKKHFPPEVLQAYKALNPGAFKADLFRYCVLLIYGGVYADMDVMLESNLDEVVGPDVGFMVPLDEPGKPVEKRMCLWNGFLAVAPGHPFLAKAIETIVNNVRNRFTSVDMDQSFCPDPELSVLHAFDTLFTAGPCILGGVVNKVLGRHGQTQYEAGEVDPLNGTNQAGMQSDVASFVVGLPSDTPMSARIPGRTIILHQNKWDMGAHRFTLVEKNMVVAATDMPDYDDRENLVQDDNHKTEHYSKTHVRIGIYGLEMLYANRNKANEDIRILVNGKVNQFTNQS